MPERHRRPAHRRGRRAALLRQHADYQGPCPRGAPEAEPELGRYTASAHGATLRCAGQLHPTRDCYQELLELEPTARGRVTLDETTVVFPIELTPE
jgi:hypothetical protein